MLDTNIVNDLLEADQVWHRWSVDAVALAESEAPLAISAIVVGELATRSMAYAEILALLDGFGFTIAPLGAAEAHRAGLAHRAYREAGGTRDRLLGDFLIGAHAEMAGARLLTRDPRPYRTYFPDLNLITPETDA
jgi:predicted nucleic acid-binding protein